MPNLDVFKGDAFSVQSLTDAINKQPRLPTKLAEIGLFKQGGISTTKLWIEEKQGELTLLQTSPRGAPASQYLPGKRNARGFTVPHVTLESSIYADEIQDIRRFGSESELETVVHQVNERMNALDRNIQATWEHMQIGALKGEIVDADGTTIYDLHDEFGTSPNEATFDFSTASTSIRNQCLAVKRSIEDELESEPHSGIHAFCGPAFFDALINHPDVKEAYARFQDGAMLRDDVRSGFPFAGIVFEEYRAHVKGTKYLSDDACYAFPLNTSLFIQRNAPADFLDTANSIGLPRYARMDTSDGLQRSVTLHVQSNPLPICVRPSIVVKINAG